jgi:hypothetical protein
MQPGDLAKALTTAVLEDEATQTPVNTQVASLAAAAASQKYTAVGAIAPKGLAVLKTGAASAMTLAAPAADFDELTIVSADGEAYTVTTAANLINGADDTLTFGGAIGDSISLAGLGGKWIVNGTPSGVTLSEV